MAAVLPLLNSCNKQLFMCALPFVMLHRLKCLYKCYIIGKNMHLYAGHLHVSSANDSGYHNVISNGNLHLQNKAKLSSLLSMH